MNDTLSLLNRHRSIRHYTDDPLLEEDVRAAVAAGQRASTSSAIEAYCCIRIRSAETLQRLVTLTGGQTKVADAAGFFVICGDTRRHRLAAERAGRPYDSRLEAFLLAVIDATLDPAPAGFRRGDLDANSQVSVTDAVLLLRILFGLQVAHRTYTTHDRQACAPST